MIDPYRYFSTFPCIDETWEALWEEAAGYMRLGLYHQAIQLLHPSMRSGVADPGICGLYLLACELNGCDSNSLSEMALSVWDCHPGNKSIFHFAILHLCIAERYDEVLALLGHEQSQAFHDGITRHHAAIALAHTGHFDAALQMVAESMTSHDNATQLVTDPQLMCLWEHWAANNPPPQIATLLLKREFDVLIAATEEQAVRWLCEYGVRRSLPPRLAAHLEKDPASGFAMPATAPRKVRRRFHRWLEALKRRQVSLVRRARQRALNTTGLPQPSLSAGNQS